MKNSLIKRAIAAVATVPLALTQCLGVANAITVDDSALSVKENSSVKADEIDTSVKLTGKGGLLYITPDESLAKYELQSDGTTFIQDSVWNAKVDSIISNISRRSGTFDMSGVYNEAIGRAGKYQEVVKMFIDHLSDFTYTIDDNNIVTIECTLYDITPDFVDGGKKTIGGALKEIAEKYNVPELENDRKLFSDVVIAGKGKLVIDASDVINSETVNAKFTFTDASGKVWNGADILNYVINSFETLKKDAQDTVLKYQEQYGIDLDDAYKTIENNIDFYINNVKWGKSKIEAYTEGSFSFEATDTKDAIAKLKSRVEKTRIAKFNYYTNHKGAIPDSGEDAATKDWANRVFRAFANNVKNLVAPYTVDFTLDDFGTEIDRVTDISAVLTSGKTGTVEGTYPDDEFDDVVSYFAKTYPDYEVISSHKEATVSADYSNLFTDAEVNASAKLEYIRVVEVKPIETTTTTTGTTTSTTTETTSATETETATDTGTGTETETATDTGTGTETETATNTGTGTGTETETATDTGTGTETETATDTGTGTETETATDTGTGTETETATGTETETATDTGTGTETETATDTDTETETATDTETETATGTETETETATETETGTGTETETATGVVEPGSVYAVATASTVDGYYFSHDSRPFDKGHVENSINIVVVDEDGVVGEPQPVDMSRITFKEVNSGADNPAGAFKGPNSLKAYTIEDFYYEVQVYYDGELLTYENGSPVNFHVFIGVKGDANFDMSVDSTDASSVLSYYSKRSVAKTDEERASVRLSPLSCAIVNEAPGLDDFAAFLVDVDLDVYSEANQNMPKSEREINSSDASSILSYYSKRSSGKYADYSDNDIWNEVIKGREEKMTAYLG